MAIAKVTNALAKQCMGFRVYGQSGTLETLVGRLLGWRQQLGSQGASPTASVPPDGIIPYCPEEPKSPFS